MKAFFPILLASNRVLKMIVRIVNSLSKYSPWVIFIPFLLLWLGIAVTQSDNSLLVGDEVRYWGFADNLLHGHFHDLNGDRFLWSGPGYSITLMPFRAFDTPLWIPKAMNAIYFFLAAILFFKALSHYFDRSKSYLLSLLFCCYYPLYSEALPALMTEALTILLIMALIFSLARLAHHPSPGWKQCLLPGGIWAYLVLTKIIFGYVVFFLAAVMLIAWFRNKEHRKVKAMARTLGLATLFLLPYLTYTFVLTGKPMYWGNSGGLSLYWMSSPFEDELGDWHGPSLREHPKLMENHGEFFASIQALDPVAKDDALKKQAIANIKAHPKKFALNCVSNVGRTLFSYPLSYLKPSNGIFYYLVPNIFILVLGLLFLYPTIRHHKRFPTEMLLLLTFMFLYLAGLTFVSSYARFFFLAVPIFVWWIGYGLDRFVKVDFSKTASTFSLPEKPHYGREVSE